MIKVYINKVDWQDALNFYIIDQNEFDHKRYVLHFEKYNITREELQDYAVDVEPTFKLNALDSKQFLKEMAEKANEFGIKLESDLKRDGKLEATLEHLKDMRKLVFKEQL